MFDFHTAEERITALRGKCGADGGGRRLKDTTTLPPARDYPHPIIISQGNGVGQTAVSDYYVVYGFCGAPLIHVLQDNKTCSRTEFGGRRRKAFERYNCVSARTRLSTSYRAMDNLAGKWTWADGSERLLRGLRILQCAASYPQAQTFPLAKY